jgi:hypothetical protein
MVTNQKWAIPALSSGSISSSPLNQSKKRRISPPAGSLLPPGESARAAAVHLHETDYALRPLDPLGRLEKLLEKQEEGRLRGGDGTGRSPDLRSLLQAEPGKKYDPHSGAGRILSPTAHFDVSLVGESPGAIRRGWYPPVIDRRLDPELWYENYIATYLERDVRLIENIRDLSAFRRFLYLSAGRTGQLVNLSEFAGECGVSHNTIKAWISILEASFLIRLVQPYHRNYNKRVVKAPRLYFLDTGLAARLLGIRTDGQLDQHPLRGALFETMIYGELVKRRHNTHAPWDIYFWRDHGGTEVDFILEEGTQLTAVEVKSGATFHQDFIASLSRFSGTAGKDLKRSVLVYGGTESFDFKGVAIVPWNALWSGLSAAGGIQKSVS